MEPGQGERVGDKQIMEEGCGGGDGARVSNGQTWPPIDRLSSHADGEEPARPERDHCYKQFVRGYHQ